MTLVSVAVTGMVPLRAQDTTTPPTSLLNALPADATGEQIFATTCSTCHGPNGAGAVQTAVGFALPLPDGHAFPDFNDCATNTVEPLGDWVAVAARGGPVRGLDRHMPAFGDALSVDQLTRVVKYLWTFCKDPAWPRGDLNLPRAFFTEKAFPENETVWTSVVGGSSAKTISNQLAYEHRLGARGQYEVMVPVNLQANTGGAAWSRGIGDIELALRRTVHASSVHGTIVAAGGALTLPTGKENEGLGNGVRIYEPFAMWGQLLGQNGSLQVHGGYEISSDRRKAPSEAFLRTALGYTVAQDRGFGRQWSPMAEVILARPSGAATELNVVPQMQVSLSKLQHILLSVGVNLPINQRGRTPQLLTYVVWDWFDGGLFSFWK
jgi:mono/diheme cytochrome c family protein